MPIAINGSGSITGISAGGLPDGVITTDDLAANAVTTAKLGSGEASGLCKAWVNFDGTGTVAIRASYNVSSITDNGTGDYTVNFTTALADANFSICGMKNNQSSNIGANLKITTFSSTSVRITSFENNTATDCQAVCVAVFR
jgi:hypothetical protein